MNESRRKRTNRQGRSLVELLEGRSYLTAISLASHVDLQDGTAPIAIVTADFNGDGFMDLATADQLARKVNVFYGSASGTFTAGPVLSLNSTPTAMVVGDFNHDGLPDLAVAGIPASGSGSTTITVFLSTGNNTFGLGQITTVTPSANTGDSITLVTGDFNGDGNPDIATANFAEGTVSVLIGTGTGTFQAPVTYPVGKNPSSIVTGHFDNITNLDLAVADQAAGNGGGNTDEVTLLNGATNGTFTVGPNIPLTSTTTIVLATADFNSDGLTDLAAGSLDDSVQILGNNGSEQFTTTSTVSTSGPVAALALADLNFDGIPDLIAAQGGTLADPGNDNVSIAAGIGPGEFSTPIIFPTASAPVGLAVADFNDDQKPDIATANSQNGTISILSNETGGTPQEKTTTTLTTTGTPEPYGTPVSLTATVTGPTGDGLPTGSVNFYQGPTLLGTATIGLGLNTAVLTSTTLGVGTDLITARYEGGGLFLPSTSAALSETITPIAGQGPDLVGTFVSTTLPSTFVPGERGTVAFRITNQGNFTGTGAIANTLYLSLDGTLDAGDIPVTVHGSLATKKLKLAPQKSVVLSGSFTVPASLPLADYVLLVDVNATGTLLESDTTNNTAASPIPLAAVDEFGNVGGKAGVQLELADADGTEVTYKLNGPGTGTVNVGDSGIDVSIVGTTAASALTITGKGGDGIVELNDISVAGAIAAITAATTNIGGDVTLSGGVSRLQLNNFSGNGTNNPNILTIGGGTSPTIRLGTAFGLALTSVAGIKSLTATNIESDFYVGIFSNPGGAEFSSISAPWIGQLTTKGPFTGQLTLNGSGSPGGMALGVANIGGTISNSDLPPSAYRWSVAGNVGRLAIHGSTTSWDACVTGQVRSFTDVGNFAGDLAAASFGAISITGDLSGDILAGADFGADGAPGGGDDTFASGSITSLHIGGNSTSTAIIAAGLDPVGDNIVIDPSDTLFTTGFIKSLTINGTADPAARFVAATLPPKVRIGKTTVIPSTDPRFQL